MIEENLSLNEEKDTLPGDALPEEKPELSGDDTPNPDDNSARILELEQTISSLNDKLSKSEIDKENYKTGMLAAKDELKKLKPQEKSPVINPEDNYAEREGKAQFKLKYPTEDIKNLLPFYKNIFGNDTATGVIRNLEEAIKYRDYRNQTDATSINNSSQGAGVSQPSSDKGKKIITARQREIALKSGNKPEDVYKD